MLSSLGLPARILFQECSSNQHNRNTNVMDQSVNVAVAIGIGVATGDDSMIYTGLSAEIAVLKYGKARHGDLGARAEIGNVLLCTQVGKGIMHRAWLSTKAGHSQSASVAADLLARH